MAQLRVQRLRYEDPFGRQSPLRQVHQIGGRLLTTEQNRISEAQLRIQCESLNLLLQGGDTLLLKLIKLKVSNEQLGDTLKEVNEATHRYPFWTSDVRPMAIAWPLEVAQDLRRPISLSTFSQLSKTSVMMLTSREAILPLSGALTLIGCSIYSCRYFTRLPGHSAAKVGKVTRDHSQLTLRILFQSILVASPLPVLWVALGYGLYETRPYPLAVAIGDGVTATVSLLWAVVICTTFACLSGLFIAHSSWPCKRASRGMRYYLISIGFIAPLIMALIMFDNLDNCEFSGLLGRLCFILICDALAVVALSLKKAGIPLYLNKESSGDNITNYMLWNMMTDAPLIVILASTVGYLAMAQALPTRLETSVTTWFLLLAVCHVIRCWVLIQRRRPTFDQMKHRQAEMLARRTCGKEEARHHSSPEGAIRVDGSKVDLNAINAQSLRLVRSTLMLTALLSAIMLWSEIHSAFDFLEDTSLQDVTSMVQGVGSLEPTTLGAILTAILAFIIITQLVRDLPALLELAILQHLDLTPGIGYVTTTITKYLLMLVDGLIDSSMIGTEWSKLQWLIAAPGIDLGFGLQEILANFISGLIILFEKPIRIGNAVAIRGLTDGVTKINTRATTVSDQDHKEIIAPDEAFITEQFINWSLSDSVTCVVLMIPAPADANSEEVAEILLTVARRCSLMINDPAPEVLLVDLQQGIQALESCIYAIEMGHRMSLRHEIYQLILAGSHAHGINMPFPPFQMRLESLNGKRMGRALTSAGKGRQARSL